MKRKIFSLLLCLLIVSQCAVFAFADEIYTETSAPTVTLQGFTKTTEDDNGLVKEDVPVIGYTVTWGAPYFFVKKTESHNKYWDPNTLAYVVDQQDQNPTVAWRLDSEENRIATVTNRSNVAIQVTADFTPNNDFANAGLQFVFTPISLAKAEQGQAGGSKSLSFQGTAFDNLGDDVAAKLYSALNGTTSKVPVGTFTIRVSVV